MIEVKFDINNKDEVAQVRELIGSSQGEDALDEFIAEFIKLLPRIPGIGMKTTILLEEEIKYLLVQRRNL